MRIIDLHSDVFTDLALRRERGERNVFETVHLPVLQKQQVAGTIAVIWVEPRYQNKLKRFQEILSYVLADLQEANQVEIVRNIDEILAAYKAGRFFIYLGLEGLTFMEGWEGDDKEEKLQSAFESLHAESFRHAIFTWNEVNFLASGTGVAEEAHSGLSRYGKQMIDRMVANKWILDVSHLDDQTFWDVADYTSYPLLASHSNAAVLCPHGRNLTNHHIKAIAASEGLIGINAYGSFVDREKPTLDRFVDHIIYIVNLVGIDYVGFGFDFVNYLQDADLGDDLSNMTKGLEDVTKIPDLLTLLQKRGFSEAQIRKLAYENFFRFMNQINEFE